LRRERDVAVATLLRGKQFVQQRQHWLGGLRCQTLQHFGSNLGGGVTVFGHGGFFQVAYWWHRRQMGGKTKHEL